MPRRRRNDDYEDDNDDRDRPKPGVPAPVIIGVVVAALGFAGLLGVGAMVLVFSRSPAPAPNAPNVPAAAAIVMDADEFMSAIGDNSAWASKYAGKTVRLTGGKFRSVMPTIGGPPYLQLQTPAARNPRSESPRFFFNNISVAGDLKPGDPVTIEGVVSTNGGIVDFSKCSLVK